MNMYIYISIYVYVDIYKTDKDMSLHLGNARECICTYTIYFYINSLPKTLDIPPISDFQGLTPERFTWVSYMDEKEKSP